MAAAPPEPTVPSGIEARWRPRRNRWRFRVRWTDPVRRADGTKRRPAEEFDTIAEAQAFQARLGLARARGDVAELTRGDGTLADFVELEWRPRYLHRSLARSTERSYLSVYRNHVAPHLAHLRLRHITAPVLARLRDALLENDVNPPTVRRALVIIQGICSFAIESGALEVNPAREVAKPPVTRQRAILLPSAKQIEQLLAELDPDSAMLVELMAYQGLRPQEALALERRHRQRTTLLIEQKWVDGQIEIGLKTGRRRHRTHRQPSLYAPVAARLDEHLARRRVGARALLFPNPAGQPWSESAYSRWRRNEFKPAVERAGLEITRPYDLRHACASLMLHAGVPLREIAEHLGHSVSTLSANYAHLIADLKGHTPVPVEQQITEARFT